MALPPDPPLGTADLPGIGGRIKHALEDFEVEEVPAYEPSGQGDFLFLWVEKRGLGAEYFVRQITKRLGLAPGEVGTAGLKDRQAVARQWVSVPATVEPKLGQLDGDGLTVLRVSRHGNKLKPGHLRGNRFRILIRGADPTAAPALETVCDRLRRTGVPNYYGPQRFGRDGSTLDLGMTMLHGERTPRPGPFLRKLALSAAQSALFNDYLGRRLRDGLLRTVLPGDVMAKWPVGGLFVAEDRPREQERFDARETVMTGPIFGRKTFPARADALAREQAVLADAGLAPAAFAGFGKLLQGTRRHNLVYVDDLAAEWGADGVWIGVTLPAGSYATVLLREVTKTPWTTAEGDAAEED